MHVRHFETPERWRAWLEEHHATERECFVGFRRKASGLPTMTWQESVKEALCFGWIDGVTRRVDEVSYCIRFTPRRKGSNWSQVNVALVQELIAEGRMTPAGLAAFEARREDRTGVYSFEGERPEELPPEYAAVLGADPAAAKDFAARSPYYRRAAVHWVTSAKREDTRQRRLAQLVTCSAEGRKIPPLA